MKFEKKDYEHLLDFLLSKALKNTEKMDKEQILLLFDKTRNLDIIPSTIICFMDKDGEYVCESGEVFEDRLVEAIPSTLYEKEDRAVEYEKLPLANNPLLSNMGIGTSKPDKEYSNIYIIPDVIRTAMETVGLNYRQAITIAPLIAKYIIKYNRKRISYEDAIGLVLAGYYIFFYPGSLEQFLFKSPFSIYVKLIVKGWKNQKPEVIFEYFLSKYVIPLVAVIDDKEVGEKVLELIRWKEYVEFINAMLSDKALKKRLRRRKKYENFIAEAMVLKNCFDKHGIPLKPDNLMLAFSMLGYREIVDYMREHGYTTLNVDVGRIRKALSECGLI